IRLSAGTGGTGNVFLSNINSGSVILTLATAGGIFSFTNTGGNVSSGSTSAGLQLAANVTAPVVVLSTVAANARNNGTILLGDGISGTFTVTASTSAAISAGGSGSILETRNGHTPAIVSPSIVLATVSGNITSDQTPIPFVVSSGSNLSLTANTTGNVQIETAQSGSTTLN